MPNSLASKKFGVSELHGDLPAIFNVAIAQELA